MSSSPSDPPTSAAPWWRRLRLLHRLGMGRMTVEEYEREANGVTLPTEHRCKPPHAHEWPPGKWKLDKDLPIGSEWTC